MKAIILAAGYSTRLYPLTENTPKPLLEVAFKKIIERILEKLNEAKIGEVIIVSNHKFIRLFEEWKKRYSTNLSITILDDGSTSNEDRLGAIGDVNYAIENQKLNDDIIVIAGDNLFEFELADFIRYFKDKRTAVFAVHDIKSIELARQFGVVELDSKHKLIGFEEKPKEPKTTLISTACYIYPAEILHLINKYIKEGNIRDAPGNFLAWLYSKKEVYCYVFLEKWFDVGTFEALDMARIFYQKKKDKD